MRPSALLPLLLLALALPCAAAAPASPPRTDSTALEELSAQWWQWAEAVPDEVNPVRDLTGAHCDEGQAGSVWFLAGGFGSSRIHRRCQVPTGKALFFPVINMAYYPTEPAGVRPATCAEARAAARVNNDSAIDLFAELDGIILRDLRQQRVTTRKCFDIFARLPAEERPYDGYPSASDGFWILLPPLPPGRHRLHFGGRYNQHSSAYGTMLQDIEYELVIGDSLHAPKGF